MTKGLFDQGKSFDRGLELLDKDFYIRSYLSEKTFSMLDKAKEAVMQNYDFTKGFTIITSYLTERWDNLIKNLDFGFLILNISGFVILGLLTGPGKFSVMSPLFTGWYPTVLGLIASLFSVAF